MRIIRNLLPTLLLGVFITSTAVAQDHNAFKQEVHEHGKLIVEALNNADADFLLGAFVQTEDAFFVLNGRGAMGYEAVAGGLSAGISSRKAIEITVKDETITVLDNNCAVQIVHFSDVTTAHDNSKTTHEGLWTAFYQKVDGELKVVGVHESYNEIAD